jgi:hypothetical protein
MNEMITKRIFVDINGSTIKEGVKNLFKNNKLAIENVASFYPYSEDPFTRDLGKVEFATSFLTHEYGTIKGVVCVSYKKREHKYSLTAFAVEKISKNLIMIELETQSFHFFDGEFEEVERYAIDKTIAYYQTLWEEGILPERNEKTENFLYNLMFLDTYNKNE